jgi:hypothetical protein
MPSYNYPLLILQASIHYIKIKLWSSYTYLRSFPLKVSNYKGDYNFLSFLYLFLRTIVRRIVRRFANAIPGQLCGCNRITAMPCSFNGASTFSITTFSVTTIIIMTLSITTLRKMTVSKWQSAYGSQHNGSQHNGLNCDTHHKRPSA